MRFVFILILTAWVMAFGASMYAQSTHLLFSTDSGTFKVMLYDFTPKHKALMLEQIKKKAYKKAFFNRIVDGFVVQGGELDDVILEREKASGVNEGRLAPEFNDSAFHKIGALGAGRDDNLEKASFFKQIYFVVGKPVDEAHFETLAVKYNKHFSEERKAYYLKNGGQPRLDGDYTVFGEVAEGLDVLLRISKAKSNSKTQLAKKPIKFEITVLKNLEE